MIQRSELLGSVEVRLGLCINSIASVYDELLQQREGVALGDAHAAVLTNLIVVEVEVLKLRQILG